jgi:hypothetical protein
VAAKHERLTAGKPSEGFLGTVSEAIDMIGELHDAAVELLTQSDRRNGLETRGKRLPPSTPRFGSVIKDDALP